MMQFDAVIFDMDGLLVDSEPAWMVCEREMLGKRGKQWSLEIQKKLIGMRMDDFLKGMKEGYALDDEPHILRGELLDGMQRLIPAEVEARPGASELLAYLYEQGISCAIASSSAHVVIDMVVESQGWAHYFQTRVSGEDVTRGKPAPDVYVETARQLGIAPERCLALEDSPNGARAAVAAGMTCFAIPDLSHTHRDLFEPITPYVFESLHGVVAKFRESAGVR